MTISDWATLIKAPDDVRRMIRLDDDDDDDDDDGGVCDFNALSSSVFWAQIDEAPRMARMSPICDNDFIL